MSTLAERREQLRRGERALEAGRLEEALGTLFDAAEGARLLDDELRAALRGLVKGYRALGRTSAAVSALAFLGEMTTAAALAQEPRDRALLAAARGEHAQAAAEHEATGWLGHAALALEAAGRQPDARARWSVANDPRLSRDPYTAGLVRYDLARCAARLGDRAAARRATIESMHLLSAAADAFEAQGQRERAFDCSNVLIAIGRDGSFENLAEGYLNAIRILLEDGLWRYALRYYGDFVALAQARGEHHAAASLFREAAEACRRFGLVFAPHYQLRGAEAYEQAARATLAAGGAPEMAENALAAAIDGYNALGLAQRVRAVYLRLAELDLSETRKARYARLAARLEGVPDRDTSLIPFPESEEHEGAYPEVWRLDVIEWEQAGDPAATVAPLLLDLQVPESIRVRALLCRLWQLGHAGATSTARGLARLAALTGEVDTYASLAPLEALYARGEPDVQQAVLRAVRGLYFKRSYGLVLRGLADPDAGVRREALAAVAKLHFRHAFDPLSRIYRTSPDAEVRRAALGSIAKVQAGEAVELLLEALRFGEMSEKALARDLLVRADQPEAGELLRRAHADASGNERQELERLLRARGG